MCLTKQSSILQKGRVRPLDPETERVFREYRKARRAQLLLLIPYTPALLFLMFDERLVSKGTTLSVIWHTAALFTVGWVVVMACRVFRCPVCRHYLWGGWNPPACQTCGVKLRQ